VRSSTTDSKHKEKFRAVLDDNTSLSMYNKSDKSVCVIRRDLAKDYEVEVNASEAPVLNKILSDPEPYESTMADVKILEDEVFPINDAIKTIFGEEKDLDLRYIRLAIGGTARDYVSIDEKDLIKYDVKPTLTGLMDFVKQNKDNVLGFLDREYIHEEGNIIYLSCDKKNISPHIRSVKLKILASMQQRGLFLQQEHKYYGIQLYLIIESTMKYEDRFLELLKMLDIDWELIFFRRKSAINDWTQIECERNSENLKGYLRAKYDNLNYFDINNITKLVVSNQLPFLVADKIASLLYKMKVERANQLQEDSYSITLKKAEIAAAAKLACAYLYPGRQEIELEFDQDISMAEIIKYQEELTNI